MRPYPCRRAELNVQRSYLYVGLGVAVLLFTLSRTKQGAAVVATVTDAVASNVRGIRNNNPGNVRRTADNWQGLSATQADASFFQFTEMRYGVRAAARIFRNYQSRNGLRTVAQLVSRWAPPVENDTAAYVGAVAKRIGVNIDSAIDLGNEEILYRFLRAIFRHECGIVAEAIPESTVREGIALS